MESDSESSVSLSPFQHWLEEEGLASISPSEIDSDAQSFAGVEIVTFEDYIEWWGEPDAEPPGEDWYDPPCEEPDAEPLSDEPEPCEEPPCDEPGAEPPCDEPKPCEEPEAKKRRCGLL